MKVSAKVAKMIQFCIEKGDWGLGIGDWGLGNGDKEEITLTFDF